MKITVIATLTHEYEVEVTQEEYDKYLEARDLEREEDWDVVEAFDKKVLDRALVFVEKHEGTALQDLEWLTPE